MVSDTGNQPAFSNNRRSQLGATIAESLPPAQIRGPASAHTGPLAALALDHPVALLQQALALAVLAFLLLFDVGAFFIGHGILPASVVRITIAGPARPSINSTHDSRDHHGYPRKLILAGTAALPAGILPRHDESGALLAK
ncbi:hypothetical protein [Bradyrhizobium roseum]|uniref:hypothetical protein n=1 Tax=Bradyrhizobium roseum TaxID=3056648 RepID=UPI002635D636|nr:hypothetical protein [Bradyrhizobium roseus]WKA31788.1 hypothetical protein QUH67_17225 [Bradyrhizobium roseus]